MPRSPFSGANVYSGEHRLLVCSCPQPAGNILTLVPSRFTHSLVSARCRDLQAGSLRSPESALKCLFGLAYIARAIFEPGEFLQEGQRDLAHRAVTLLGNNYLGFACLFSSRLFVLLVN